jgi:hypothetical protein
MVALIVGVLEAEVLELKLIIDSVFFLASYSLF